MLQDMRIGLSLCRDIEDRCADLYFCYAQLFAENAAAAQLWEKTAHEERNHANIIKLALACREMELADSPCDLTRHRELERSLRAQCEAARTTPPSLETALRNALELETALQEFHLIQFDCFTNEQDRKMFTVLFNADKSHLAALEAALTELIG